MEEGEKPEGDIHGHHHELPMGEIDDLHHAHDERHPDADESIETAKQNSCDQGL